ncbi:hypothetical protein TWF225_003713 [Orbilia oligospora]|nr:hypothetical protein TWF225_003713 [Orbilia oligospora]KAF3267627.1 hypothetical protein TWF128_009148 [Orbilia oligospora]KAF3269167.1 hypothetical protein TWF217_009264 [Orbilia oligospora]
MHLVSGLNLHEKVMSSNVIYPPHRIKLCTKAHVEPSPFSLAEILCSQMQVYVCEQDHDVMKKSVPCWKAFEAKAIWEFAVFQGACSIIDTLPLPLFRVAMSQDIEI